MSEEILIALMKLFAIIAKQDGGVEKNEEIYVQHFLHHQLGERNHEKYYQLFLEDTRTQNNFQEGEQLTSVLDSVRILSLCKKINKTLNQQQKIVVLIRVFELVATDRKFTRQRMAILETISDTFRIKENDVLSIRNFVSGNDAQQVKDPCIVSLSQIRHAGVQREQPQFIPHGDDLLFLRIPGINLYFFKYTGKEIISHIMD